MKIRNFLAASLVAGGMLATAASASTIITLDFEGIAIGNATTAIGDFYNGGAGGDLGISFSDNALALVDSDAGGTGNFGNEPSPDTVLFFLTGAAATLNYSAGFTTGFSFFYSAINNSGSISVYDGLNATGNILATLFLPVTPQGSGDPTGVFNVFVPIGVTFDGIARSIDFGGTENQIAFDNVTFGSATPGTGGPSPIPLPAAGWMLIAGIGGLAAMRRRKTVNA